MAEQAEVKPVAVTDAKLQIASEIGSLEGEIARAEMIQRKMERNVHSIEINRTTYAVAILIGNALTLTNSPSIAFIAGIAGLTIAIASLVLFIMAIFDKSRAQRELESQDAKVAEMRGKLTELRVKFATL